MVMRKVIVASMVGAVAASALTVAQAIRFDPEDGYKHQVRYVCMIRHKSEGSFHIGSSKLLKYAKLNARTRCQYTTHSDGCTHNNLSCEQRDVWVKRAW